MIGASASASRLLLAQGVMAATHQLVRGLRDGRDVAPLRRLMDSRRRLLGELAREMDSEAGAGSLAALHAAVAESDRTLEDLLG